jgi:endonuclease YncB( thermonuclease family)
VSVTGARRFADCAGIGAVLCLVSRRPVRAWTLPPEAGMPFNIIKGQFRILHSEPDGDSVRFYPADPNAFTTLHLSARVNHSGGAQLRLDAIDALETHYTPAASGGFRQHQPLAQAHAAGALLLELLGFTDVQRTGETVTAATPEQTDGYIVTRFADKYGRPVSFVFAGETDHADLSPVFVDPELLATSANYRLAASGTVYPTYYSKLFPDLRDALTAAVEEARAAKNGVWAGDVTTIGATINQLSDLTDEIVILPKLFRRLVDYLALGTPDVSLAGFRAYLATRDDRLFVLPTGHATGLDTIITVEGQTVLLTVPPEQIVFLEA